jgi:Flp pilus assembly pilin Flp
MRNIHSDRLLGAGAIARFLSERRGATLVGYGIVLALIAMVSLASTRDLGLEVERVFRLGAGPLHDINDVPAVNTPPVWVTEAGDLGAFVSEKTIAFQLEATDAEDGAPTFTLAAGTLPSGVSLSATGLVAGSTTDQGTHDFTVEIADSEGAAVEQDFRMEVIPPYIEFTEPGQHGFTVPQGVTSFEVAMWGGGGGSSRSEAIGGAASAATATVTAAPGQAMIVWVGGGGGGYDSPDGTSGYPGGVGYRPGGDGGYGDAFSGGGGGGASALLTSSGEAIVVVGGGGGAGGFGGDGGSGLGATGQDGGTKSGGGRGGKGATQDADGIGGAKNGNYSEPGLDGSASGGGDGGAGYKRPYCCGYPGGGGGGGGGGWYSGGGGSGHDNSGGGGGAGSSYINGSLAVGDLYGGAEVTTDHQRLPGNASHPHYPEGVGAGKEKANGGDGYVRIEFN